MKGIDNNLSQPWRHLLEIHFNNSPIGRPHPRTTNAATYTQFDVVDAAQNKSLLIAPTLPLILSLLLHIAYQKIGRKTFLNTVLLVHCCWTCTSRDRPIFTIPPRVVLCVTAAQKSFDTSQTLLLSLTPVAEYTLYAFFFPFCFCLFSVRVGSRSIIPVFPLQVGLLY